MSWRGIVLQLSYRLRRHLFLSWSLARWLGLLLLGAIVVLLARWWTGAWPAVAVLGVLFLVYVAVLAWAARRKYLFFEPLAESISWPEGEAAIVPVRIEELVPARASGWFTVQGKDRYYVDLPAHYQTVPSREHIILARVFPSRFLLLGGWPEEDEGWWYMFFLPAMIQCAEVGRLHFGPRPRLALRLVYAPDAETEAAIYLTFDSAPALARVWLDLRTDAPPGVMEPLA